MKKILSVLVAVAFLAGPAFAAEDKTEKTPAPEKTEKKLSPAAQGAKEEKQHAESHLYPAKKKAKKAKKGHAAESTQGQAEKGATTK